MNKMTLEEFIAEHVKVADWSNDGCRGYVIQACKNLEIPKSYIHAVLNELRHVFDLISVEEAESIYYKF